MLFDYAIDMIDIDTKLVRSFLAVAAERSFSGAARTAGCSQATMSQRIQALEEQLGARLFERKRRGAILTAAGNELLPNAEALIDLHDRLVGRAHSKRVAGSVRLGVAECQAVPLLPKLLKHTCATYEAVELAVLCQQSGLLQEAMRNGTLDLAIVALLDEVPSALRLASPRLHWVAAPEFDLDSRSPIPVACAPGRDFFHKKGMTALRSHGIVFREALCSVSDEAIRAAVLAGTAITIMPEGTIPPELGVISRPSLLPRLGRCFVQLLERPGRQSEATVVIKREILRAYHGS